MKKLFITFSLLALGYVIGVYSFAHQIWPLNIITASRNSQVAKELQGNFNKFGAYSRTTGKMQVTCPLQNKSTAVVLVLGQSNAGNHAEKKYITQYPTRVLNYYLGKCYSAESPLLGASGLEGEYLTPMADALIEGKIFSDVIIVEKSIAGSTIDRWAKGGDLFSDLVSTLNALESRYRVTQIIWHQGESDFLSDTSTEKYRQSFLSLKETLGKIGIKAPIFMFISTKCGYNTNWIVYNQVAVAQQSLIDNREVFLGVDTDSTLLESDRRPQSPSQEPSCHLSQQGQRKIAESISKTILQLNK